MRNHLVELTGNEESEALGGTLGRTQRRLLRRIFNGRIAPIIADGQPFLTYKEASRHLLSLEPDAREAAYLQMKQGAE